MNPNLNLDDTIAAVSTPLGEGGLAVVRMSGRRTLAIADQVFQPAARAAALPSAVPSHTLHYGRIRQADRTVDEVMLAVLRAPRTFTREDTVEISCHGGLLPAKLVLDALLHHGARVALPGEFTKRAFLNGRIDLTQAEAVADLIHSRTELALAAANEQLAGRLSHHVNTLRDSLMQALAHIEAHIDFPDQDIAPDTRAGLVGRLDHASGQIDRLLRTAGEGQILRRGIRAAIVGRPNAGKSSLLNQLLGRDRAIVSAIAGTTRDTVEETANVRGIPVVFIDTAGLREAGDAIEVEGVRRSRDVLARAELVLHVLDAAEPFTDEDGRFLKESSETKRVLILNKSDLPRRLALPETSDAPAVEVCCVSGQGIESLKETICRLVWGGAIRAEMLEVTVNSRHQDALRRAQTSLAQSREALVADLSLELVAMDLRIAVNAIGEIVGKTSTEDLLDCIFSQFCLGK